MRNERPAVSTRRSSLFLKHPRFLNIPQYHLLILTWSALIILYGEASLSLSVRKQRTLSVQPAAHR